MSKTLWAAELIERCLTAWEARVLFTGHAGAGWLLRSFEDMKMIEKDSPYTHGTTMYEALSSWKSGERITEEHRKGMQRCITELREAGGER